MANMTNSHASLPPRLSEVERSLYINNDPRYAVFTYRVDEEFLKPFLRGYEQNRTAIENFVTGLTEELGLEEVLVGSLLPEMERTQTPREFVQSQLF